MNFLTDENFNGPVFRALRRVLAPGSIVRVQDVGLMSADDPTVLEWAAINDHIVLTHDVKTFKDFAYDRIAASLPMPGVIEVTRRLSLRLIVEQIQMIEACSTPDEWRDRVVYLPI
jgi:predicted nuclease of predicted toxin-antitoxin system